MYKKFNSFLDNAQLLKDNLNIMPLLYDSLGFEVLTNYNFNSDDIDILIPEIFLERLIKIKECVYYEDGDYGYEAISLYLIILNLRN